MTKTTTRTELDKTDRTELTHVFKKGQPIVFESGYHHYIHAGALEGIDQITVSGLKNAEIYFLAPLSGFAVYEDSFRADSGVLNVVDCENIIIEGLVAENRNEFRPGNIVIESSCVVNVMASFGVKFANCDFVSHGKTAVSVHSGSTVEIYDSLIKGHYFELFNGASSLTVTKCVITQDSPNPDSHSMLWVSSSNREAIRNTLHENGHTIFRDNKFVFASGRSLVTGNGSYHTLSRVDFEQNELVRNAGAPEMFGVCTWNRNYQSINVLLLDSSITPKDDYIESPSPGFAKFVNYSGESLDAVRPGGPNGESPIIVAGVSSAKVNA